MVFSFIFHSCQCFLCYLIKIQHGHMQINAILVKRLDIYLSLPFSKLDWRKGNFLSYHEYIEFYFLSTIKEVLVDMKVERVYGILGRVYQASHWFWNLEGYLSTISTTYSALLVPWPLLYPNTKFQQRRRGLFTLKFQKLKVHNEVGFVGLISIESLHIVSPVL